MRNVRKMPLVGRQYGREEAFEDCGEWMDVLWKRISPSGKDIVMVVILACRYSDGSGVLIR